MKNGFLFLLGAGASAPEMPVYRGVQNKASIAEILEKSMKIQPPPFYDYLKQNFKSDEDQWLIVTQNIDRFANRSGLPTIPVHLRIKADSVSLDEILTEDMVVKSGEDIDEERMVMLCEKVSEITRKYSDYSLNNWDSKGISDKLIVVIIGTSLPYPYLREVVIDPAKNMGAKIIHINPDENYDKIVDDIDNDREFRVGSLEQFKPEPILRKDEEWWKMNAYDGIKKLFNLKA